MERVDVVVVGGGIEGLACAKAATQGGVRTLLLDGRALPRGSEIVRGLSRIDLEAAELSTSDAERAISFVKVGDAQQALCDENMVAYTVSEALLEGRLLSSVRHAGAEVRDETSIESIESDGESWRITPSNAEPIEARIMIIADGAHSPALFSMGLAQRERFTPSLAEIMTFAIARFEISDARADQENAYRIRTTGPLGTLEVLPGSANLTVAFGPIWRGIHDRSSGFASAAHPAASFYLRQVTKLLELDSQPTAMETDEWRIDALCAPATFEGGIVIGNAAGHRPHSALMAHGTLVRSGILAGKAAASAIHQNLRSVRELSHLLGDEYRDAVACCAAEVSYEAAGLYSRRDLKPDFWRPEAR